MLTIHHQENLLMASLLTQLSSLSYFLLAYCGGYFGLDTTLLLIFVQAVISLAMIITGTGKSLAYFGAIMLLSWSFVGEEYRITSQGHLMFIGFGVAIVSVFLYILAVSGKAGMFSAPSNNIAEGLLPFIVVELLGILLILGIVILLAFDDGRGWAPNFG